MGDQDAGGHAGHTAYPLLRQERDGLLDGPEHDDGALHAPKGLAEWWRLSVRRITCKQEDAQAHRGQNQQKSRSHVFTSRMASNQLARIQVVPRCRESKPASLRVGSEICVGQQRPHSVLSVLWSKM